MNISIFLKTLLGILICGVGFSLIYCENNHILPGRALVIFTRESWGCLSGQEIKEDVSITIGRDDGNYVTIEEIKNPEDIFNRYEIFLIFPAILVNQLPGNFVVKFWCDNDQSEEKAYLSMEWASLHKRAKEWILTTKLKSNGFVHIQMLYSRMPEIRQAWFSCQGEGTGELYQLTFFNAYPLEGEFGSVPEQKLNGKWERLDLTFNPIFLEESRAVDRCQLFLNVLDRQFAIKDSSLVWDSAKVDEGTIRSLVIQSTVETKELDVMLRKDDRTIIQIGSESFVPHVRQKLALRNPDGKLVGGEIWLRANL